MAPLYQYDCTSCKAITEDIRPVQERRLPQGCACCGARTTLRFSLVTCKTYPAYTDGQMGEVRSYGHERELLKKHGKVLAAETPQWDKFKQQRRKALKKPMFSTSAGTTRLNRD